jgi:hypothetical protein
VNTTIIALLSLLCQTAPVGVQDAPKTISKEKSAITFYGFLRLDAFVDSSRPQNPQIPIWILSPDDTGNAEEGGRSDFSMSARLTRLGLDFDGPTIADLGDAKITGKLELDFYNLNAPATSSAATANSRAIPRMRHAWGKVDWGSFSILFGQRFGE